jgi:putative hydrolase of the HAD superfamily
MFQRIFVSSEMGVRKPEPRSYEAVSRELGIPLDRMVFYDDTQENVEGARAVGMQAVHVRSSGDVARSVTALVG